MGVGLRRQFNDSIAPKRIQLEMFRGSASVDHPEAIYEDGGDKGKKSNKQTFYNKRSQYYWLLRDRIYKTYLAVKEKRYFNPNDLISFSSNIEAMDLVRSELCRIPSKPNAGGHIQIMTKKEMRSLGIDSPNIADSIMMNLANPEIFVNSKPQAVQVVQKSAVGWT